MRPLDAFPAEEAQALAGVVFDLDDTLLDHGMLREHAYSALFRLREAGLRLIACTGRPAGWGDLLVRQWPIDAAVLENGAVALVPDGEGRTRLAFGSRDPRSAERAGLLDVAHAMIERFPAAALADDNEARWSDVTIDIGEHRLVPEPAIASMCAIAAARGIRTTRSSVHLHLTHEAGDKASGTARLIALHFGEDATSLRFRYAYVGDSENDAAPFAAFATTFGVENVRACVGRLSVPPRYVTSAPMGEGFARIAARLAALRVASPGGEPATAKLR